jgi:hypothetical protein
MYIIIRTLLGTLSKTQKRGQRIRIYDFLELIYNNVNYDCYPADYELYGNFCMKYYPNDYLVKHLASYCVLNLLSNK